MNGRKIFLAGIALIEWFSLIAQKILQSENALEGKLETLTRFFTFFTITTNLLVAIWATVLLFTRKGNRDGFWSAPGVQTALTIYITVVGLIYNVILRNLWDSHGLQFVVHDLLHTLLPLMVIFFWARWVNARSVRYRDIPRGLIYPALYAIIIVIRGLYSGWYPYPFMDITQLGTQQVLINSIGVMLVFVVLSIIYVFVGRRKKIPSPGY